MVQECSDLRWGSFSQASRPGQLDPVMLVGLLKHHFPPKKTLNPYKQASIKSAAHPTPPAASISRPRRCAFCR